MLTNIKIPFEERDAELDNVVLNNRGVFIIEVKNYNCYLNAYFIHRNILP